MGIGVGLVGCGSFGRHFMGLYQQHPEVERFALCDLDPEKLGECAARFGVTETYQSLDDLCDSSLDAVVLITQHWKHAPQAVQVLRSGKHVYSAVPAAASLAECQALVSAVRETGLRYMMGETSYFRRDAAYCRQRARAGEFGTVALVEAEYLHDVDHGLREVARWRWGKDWDPSKSGGVPMHYPTHSMCFPVTITNSHAVSVSCLGFEKPNDDWHRKDTISGNTYANETALFGLADGSVARICEYRACGYPGAERVTRVVGTEATYEAWSGTPQWATKQGIEAIAFDEDIEPLPPALAADKGGHGGSHAYLVHEFVRSIVEDRHPRINVWEAMRYFVPGLLAHESAMRGGERLSIPDFGDAPEE